MSSKRMFYSSAVRATLALLSLLVSLAIPPAVSAQNDGPLLAIRMRAILTGPPINGVKPSGKAQFEQEDNGRKFSTEADNVNLNDGTVLAVRVDGVRVGSITLQAGGGALLLTGSRAPNVSKGTRVTVGLPGGALILSGKF